MPYYNLNDGATVLSEAAGSRAEALVKFGRTMRKKLTLEDQGCVPDHLMSEREESMAWVKPGDIPVWVTPDA